MRRPIARLLFFAAVFGLTVSVGAATGEKTYTGAPYRDGVYTGGAQKIPGRVECAYYDSGGEGVAYHDSDAKNNGSGGLNPADGSYLNQFRMDEGVDTSYTKFHDTIDNSPYDIVQPEENQLYVGWTEPGEWFNLTVDVAKAGVYRGDLLYTSNRGGNDFDRCEWQGCDGADLDLIDLRCFGSDCVASVASLEPCVWDCEAAACEGEECAYRAYSDWWQHESCLL
jgi:hypothetical protein